MTYRLIAPPTQEPLDLDEVKQQLRVDFSDDDARIRRHITEARQWVERRIQMAIADSTYEETLTGFPTEIELSVSPVESVLSVKYDDADGVEQTLDPADYTVFADTISPVASSWPVTATYNNSVRIQYKVGLADLALVPAPVIAAIYLKTQGLYDGADVDNAIDGLLTNYYSMVA